MRQQETRLAGQLSELERLTKEIQIQKENCRKLGQQAAKAQDAYETAHTRCETQIVDTETRRRNMREDREQRIQEIKKRMPDEGLVRKAGEALYGYGRCGAAGGGKAREHAGNRDQTAAGDGAHGAGAGRAGN